MALEIRRPKPHEVGLVADRRLYLTKDESRAVEDGSPDAAFLLATPGSVIPADLCVRLGLELADGKIRHIAPEVIPPPDQDPPPKRKRGA